MSVEGRLSQPTCLPAHFSLFPHVETLKNVCILIKIHVYILFYILLAEINSVT